MPRTCLLSIFKSAGQESGLQIWRIENISLADVPKNQYGTFYSGDSYVLLATEKFRNNTFRWNIHFWLGKESSQDERGAAAIISMQLDEYLGGSPVQGVCF